MTPRAARLAAYLLPVAACLVVWWQGLNCWFFQDDFAWLGLRFEIHSPADLLRVLFEPKAQGTIRPWSERAFFLVFFELFRMDALPYRIFVFATFVLNLLLLARLAYVLERRYVAAFLAPLLWGVNAALGTPLSWTSSYNQLLCGSFVLGALLLFIHYTRTNDRRFYLAQFAVFVFGFGALELNVAYPAIAAAYAICYAPRYLATTLPMGAVSVVYTLFHNHFAPKVRTGTYALHIDLSMFSTLAYYWRESFGGTRLENLELAPWLNTLGDASPVVLTAGIAMFAGIRLFRRDWTVLFPLAVFGALIGPVLPLRDHLSVYYLTLPTMGLALLGAFGLNAAYHLGGLPRVAGFLLAAVYFATTIPAGRGVLRYNHDRSVAVRKLVLGVERAQELHPGKTILLHNVNSELYWSAINDSPFRLVGAESVFMTPGSEESIDAHPDLGTIVDHILPAAATVRALRTGEAVVYSTGNGRLQNITSIYTALARNRWKATVSSSVEAGRAQDAEQFGEGWFPIEHGYRWMGKSALVILAGPTSAGQHLYLKGFCTAAQIKEGPIRLNVDGFSSVSITTADGPFEFEFPVRAEQVGQDRIEIRLSVDRSFVAPGDGRELGLAFGTLSIR